jgi:hypothetical protein
VDFLDARGGSSSSSAAGVTGKRNRTDYREVLSAEDFAVFAKLSDIRKAIAQAEGALNHWWVRPSSKLIRMATVQ